MYDQQDNDDQPATKPQAAPESWPTVWEVYFSKLTPETLDAMDAELQARFRNISAAEVIRAIRSLNDDHTREKYPKVGALIQHIAANRRRNNQASNQPASNAIGGCGVCDGIGLACITAAEKKSFASGGDHYCPCLCAKGQRIARAWATDSDPNDPDRIMSMYSDKLRRAISEHRVAILERNRAEVPA